jgi:peptide/nickel transport system permease protein
VVALVLRRLLATIPVMGVVALIVFGLLRVMPGDPAAIIAGDYATTQDIERIRAKLGLDQPLIVQARVWFGQVLRGDLGTSTYSGLPVVTLIKQRVEPTVALTLLSMLAAIGAAVPLGVLAAWRQGSWIDRGVMVFAVTGFSMPAFWLGFILVYLFAVRLGALPVQGYVPLGDGVLASLRHLILPALTVSLILMALFVRMTRASVLGVLREDYIRTAWAKGLTSRSVLLRHALKNAALPIVTVVGLGFALLVGGVVVTESVFAIPGIGRLTVESVIRRDYPVAQGVILIVAGLYVLINVIIDVLYVLLDPRIRY